MVGKEVLNNYMKPFNPKYQGTNILSYKSIGEKLLKYQENSPSVIISLTSP